MRRASREGELLYWGPWIMKGKLWGWASLFMGAQLGNLEWARLPVTLRDGCKWLWRWGRLSLWVLCEGNLEWTRLPVTLRDGCKWLWGWGRLSLWVLCEGNLEWARLPVTLRDGCKWLWRWGHLSLWVPCEGNLEGGLPCWVPWGIEKALEKGISFHRGPAGEP